MIEQKLVPIKHLLSSGETFSHDEQRPQSEVCLLSKQAAGHGRQYEVSKQDLTSEIRELEEEIAALRAEIEALRSTARE